MIKLIIFIVLVIAVLSYFGVSVRTIVNSDMIQDNFSFVWGWVKQIWNNYMARPARYLWNDIFIELLWNSFVDNLEKIKSGEPIEMRENAPQSDFR